MSYVNLFDVIPLLSRRALRALLVVSVFGFAVLPGPTSSFIDGQFKDLQAQITHDLMQAIPAQLKPHNPRLAGGSAASRARHDH